MDEETIRNQYTRDLITCIEYFLLIDDQQLTDVICKGKQNIRIIIEHLKSPLREEMNKSLKCVGQILSDENNENIDSLLFEGVLDIFSSLL